MTHTYLRSAADVFAWAKRLIDELNSESDYVAGLPGPFADDAAAALARVDIGGGYYDTSGIVHRRLA